MQGIENSTAVVTGGASGIGRGTARMFSRHGARVALIDVNLAGAEEAAAELRAGGGEARAYQARVTSADEMESVLDAVERDLGPIVHAFNGAGIRGVARPVAEMAIEEWRAVIDVNLTGVFLSMQAELKRMLPRGNGRIVNCTSVVGLVGGGLGASQYSASKHGVIGLTKTAALEAVHSGVRINAIAPGFTETGMTSGGSPEKLEQIRAMYVQSIPAGRSALPDEMGEVIVWMCSDAASYLVGHTMLVDGGMITGLQNVMRPTGQ